MSLPTDVLGESLNDLLEALMKRSAAGDEFATEILRRVRGLTLNVVVAADRVRLAIWAGGGPALPAPWTQERPSRFPKCPTCGRGLEAIVYPGGALNRDQWESLRAGDWWCEHCPDNDRGSAGAYFWKHEVPGGIASGAPHEVVEGWGPWHVRAAWDDAEAFLWRPTVQIDPWRWASFIGGEKVGSGFVQEPLNACIVASMTTGHPLPMEGT